MAPVQISSGTEPILMTPRQISSGFTSNQDPATPYVPPTDKELDILFQPMFKEFLEPTGVEIPIASTPGILVPEIPPPIVHQGVPDEDEPVTYAVTNPITNPFAQ
uniref:Uncharacterized protein n=1 Tax=Tanacetum cinerariifolium TaxID=118510 RepID=A0A699S906_TANCI|nr:hypothetical protein [Tanacetum cinerariifolium]